MNGVNRGFHIILKYNFNLDVKNLFSVRTAPLEQKISFKITTSVINS